MTATAKTILLNQRKKQNFQEFIENISPFELFICKEKLQFRPLIKIFAQVSKKKSFQKQCSKNCLNT